LFGGNFDRVRNALQVERELGIPVLAQFSGTARQLEITKHASSSLSAIAPVLTMPSSSSDQIRALRNSLILAEPIKTVLVTSDQDANGTLRIAVNLAMALAHSGAKILIVDTALNDPRLQYEFGGDSQPGLGEFLTGASDSLTPRTPLPNLKNLWMINSGAEDNSADLLSSNALRSLLLQWKQEFDFVVLIGTPLLTSNIGVPLASWADSTVLVAGERESRICDLKKIRDTLLRHNARILGLVINTAPRRPKANTARRKEVRYVLPDLAKQLHVD
jgi:Mrp family chromosome partitioning ATPase